MIHITWLSIVAFAFYMGCLAGTYYERPGLSENKQTLVYEGSVYVRAIEGTTLESYLTAAGKKKP